MKKLAEAEHDSGLDLSLIYPPQPFPSWLLQLPSVHRNPTVPFRLLVAYLPVFSIPLTMS